MAKSKDAATVGDEAAVAAFFRDLFADAVSETERLVLWGHGMGGAWCQSIEEAAGLVVRQGYPYFHACLHGLPARAKQTPIRGTNRTAAVLPGFWADVDWVGPGKGKVYPPDEASALQLVAGSPLGAPTLAVRTGGGIHAWWLLDAPWRLSGPDEVRRAEAALDALKGALMGAAAERGWQVDPTQDLARILRPAGAWREGVGVLEGVNLGGGRQTLEEALAKLGGAAGGDLNAPNGLGRQRFHGNPGGGPGTHVLGGHGAPWTRWLGAFDLHPDPAVPAKVEVLAGLDPRFRQTWEGKRKDLPSQSEYDMALASMAAYARWEPQEIVDLIVCHRRRRRSEPKLRVDYYARTLERAHGSARQERSLETLQELGRDAATWAGTPSERTSESASEGRAAVRSHLSDLIGLDGADRIRTIERYPGDPPTYGLLSDGGRRLQIGQAENILGQQTFRARIIDLYGIALPRVKSVAWEAMVAAIVSTIEDVDLGPEATPRGQLGGWIQWYFDSRRPYAPNGAEDDKILDGVIGLRDPIMHGGAPALNVTSLTSWLGERGRVRVTTVSLARQLRAAGCEQVKLSYVNRDGRRSTQRYWLVGALLED